MRFFNGSQVLPYETQDYVEAITGENAWKWRDDPPATIDLRLDKDRPFREACIQLAANRTLKEFGTPNRVWPWGVILAAHPSQAGAQALHASGMDSGDSSVAAGLAAPAPSASSSVSSPSEGRRSSTDIGWWALISSETWPRRRPA